MALGLIFLSFSIACQSSRNSDFFSQLGKNSIVSVLLSRATIEFLPSWLKSENFFSLLIKKKLGKMIRITFTSVLSWPNLIHFSFRVAKITYFHPHLFTACPPQFEVNSVMPRQKGRKRSIHPNNLKRNDYR